MGGHTDRGTAIAAPIDNPDIIVSSSHGFTTRSEGDDYLPGSILEIEIENFMTYDHLKCKPGSRLNLVVGPNGSGKSSLVCAIALGLADSWKGFEHRSICEAGEESGWIKISLKGCSAGQRIIITRKIDVRNKSDWMLNGILRPKRDILEVIQKFNIQVNNLTQFLPQDRVCEFAKLTPIQLLQETEKAVGNPELPVQHCALIERSNELKRLEVLVQQNGETLNQLRALNAEQEKDVERVRQRQELLEKVETMKKKLPWLKYDMKQKECREAQKQESEAKRKLDEAAKIMNDLSQPIEEKRNAKAALESKSRKITNKMSQNAKDRLEAIDIERQKAARSHSKIVEVEEVKRQEESRQQRIAKALDELVVAEKEFADCPPYEPPKDELENLANQIFEIQITANQLKSQRTDKECFLGQKRQYMNQVLRRLKEMEDKNTKLLEALQRFGADKIMDAYKWVQEHRDQFKREVFGPALLEVNVKNRNHAAYLESHVPNYVWKSFITQDADDRDFLFKNLKRYNLPVLNYVGDNDAVITPLCITQEMRELGIYSRLDQVVEAPDAVKCVLINQAALDHSFIGTQESDKRADEVRQLGISDLWTPDNHYRWHTSRYGGHILASMDPVHPSRLFLYNLDVGEVDELRHRKNELESTISDMTDDIKSLQIEQRKLEDVAAELHKQRETIINNAKAKKRKRQELKNCVDNKRIKFNSISKEDDIEITRRKLIGEAMKLNEERFHIAIKIKDLLSEAVTYKWSFAEKHMMYIELDTKIRDMEVYLKHIEKSALQASMHYENCKKESSDLKKQLHEAKHHAESICVITDDLADEFRQMPDNIEELEAAIDEHISEADSILLVNHNILEEYQNRQRKIDSIATKLETDNKELERCLSEIDKIKGSWLPTLRNLVAGINEIFSRNFREMAVAGEVLLDEHEKDFDKFGILIRVKFRQTGQLQVLSAHHQSGGERSVSTILYLVSLQDLTNCPFRVVDEINQGMDPINERKMFQQLVRASTQPSTPQCFLLTPKLLPELDYSDACSILNIMNGPWIEEPAKVWKVGGSWGEIMGVV